jgi:Predicted SAM-dependent RNA methyltransferase
MVLICTVCLGDDPPRDRTAQLRALGFPSRHLGPVQMTTDTALGVTKMVVQDKGFLFSPSLTRSRHSSQSPAEPSSPCGDPVYRTFLHLLAHWLFRYSRGIL